MMTSGSLGAPDAGAGSPNATPATATIQRRACINVLPVAGGMPYGEDSASSTDDTVAR
jgi:hypothetical protein